MVVINLNPRSLTMTDLKLIERYINSRSDDKTQAIVTASVTTYDIMIAQMSITGRVPTNVCLGTLYSQSVTSEDRALPVVSEIFTGCLELLRDFSHRLLTELEAKMNDFMISNYDISSDEILVVNTIDTRGRVPTSVSSASEFNQ